MIALAPSVLPKKLLGGFKTYKEGLGGFRDLGIYAINGPNWEADLVTISENLGEDVYQNAIELAQGGVPISMKNVEYLIQLAETQRYQIYASPDVYAADKTQPWIKPELVLEYVSLEAE